MATPISFNGAGAIPRSIIKEIEPKAISLPFKTDSMIDPMALRGPEAVELPVYPAEYAVAKGVNFDYNV